MGKVLRLLFLFYFLITSTGHHCLLAQVNYAAVNFQTKRIAEKFLAKERIPGMSVSISINDTIIFSEGFGYSDLEAKTVVVPGKTKFRMASITKTMTAATIGRLSELNLIDLKKSPFFYLDSLKRKEYDFTIEEVGGHLAGIRRTASIEKYTCDNFYSRKDFFRIFNYDKLLFEPSTGISYSNYGYKLLGVVVEKVTGTDITANHKKYIIDVLRLKNTHPETKAKDEWRSNFYVFKNKKPIQADCLDCTFKYAAGCYLSTSEDLIKLGNGYLFPDRILEKETLVDLIKSKKLKNGTKTHYGFGFSNYTDTYGNQYYGHEGGYESARSCLRIYPKYKLVISVLLNCQVEDIDSFVALVCSNYIKENK
ncbi:MAG TPA: serine hydrolase domain-containing protein [Flavobacterium sp.]|jgi:CubicO group peptidase (beta-lactamase class C family)